MLPKSIDDLPDWHARIIIQDFFKEFTGKRVGTDTQAKNIDGILYVGDTRFAIQMALRSKGLLALASKIDHVKELPRVKSGNAHPLVVVPHMSEAGKGICLAKGVHWVDLSGNADIRTPNLTLIISGKPNVFVEQGRPADIFASKNSRVVRALLQQRMFEKQSEIVDRTGLNRGTVSKLVRRLVGSGDVENQEGKLRVKNPESLLTTWAAAYQFNKHSVIKGHIPGDHEERIIRLSSVLTDAKARYAFTGLAAGDAYVSHLTSFRLVTVFVEKPLVSTVLKKLLFAQGERGANTWLAVPNDEAVFWEETEMGNIPYVSPIQAYLDLGAQPERAPELKDVLLDHIRETLWT